MSGGTACARPAEHRGSWYVTARRCNYSAFNGGHRTPSDYSEVFCPPCQRRWRTRAGYVDSLPDRPSSLA